MTNLFRTAVLSAILLVSLASCQRTVYSIRQNSLQSTSDFRHAAGNRSLPTKVYGNAFGSFQSRFDERVLQAMQTVNNGHATPLVPRTNFVPLSNNEVMYRVVVVVDPAPELPGSALCDREFQATGHAPQRDIFVRMSFCFQQSLVASVLGSTPRPDDISDPDFDRLIAHLTLRLFEAPRVQQKRHSTILLDF